jgi:ATP-dependent Clp protease protease subunit
VLGEDVDQGSVREIIKAIYDINLDDEEKDSYYKDYERTPIHLILNTYGGSVYDGLALVGAIELSQTPVVVTCLGSAMSMGLIILASGHHRRAHHLSTVMYHEMSTLMIDKLTGIKKDLKECERLEAICDKVLFRRTKLKASQLKKYKETKAEWYMSAQEALKYGIVDEIIGNSLVSKSNISKPDAGLTPSKKRARR